MIARGVGFVGEPIPLKRRLLAGAESMLQRTGAAWAYAAARRAPVAAVLNYHSVPAPEDAPWIDPSNAMVPAVFERQVRFLAEHRRVVSMSDLIGALERSEPVRPGTVVITFDDGYRDMLTVIAPILARYNLPAALYLPTGYVTRGAPQWIDRLFTAFSRRTRPIDALSGLRSQGLVSEAEAYRRLAALLMPASPAERESLLSEVEERLAPADAPPRLTLTWDEVRLLRERYPNIEIGAHTVEHTDLSSCPPASAEWEVTQSAADIERELGERPRHLSFPYSRSSPAARAAVIAAGYRSAAADGPDPVVRPDSDRYHLSRIEPTASMTMLRFMTGGAYPDLPRLLFLGRA